MRTTRFWNNLYHVHAQNLKIGKPNNLIIFGNNVFKQKQRNKKIKQKETQKTTKQKHKKNNKKTKDKAYKQKQTNKNLYNNKKQTIKQKKRLKMKGGDPNLEKFTYILYQSSGVNLT